MSLTTPENKMSKSDTERSYITLDEEPERILSKLKKAVTDAGTGGDMGPGSANLMTILEVIHPESVGDFKKQFKDGSIRYSDLKMHLAEKLAEYLGPFRHRRADLAAKPDTVWEILRAGREQAEKITSTTLAEAKKKMGFVPR
jgi:tryptophanyl-tRNA synthetase